MLDEDALCVYEAAVAERIDADDMDELLDLIFDDAQQAKLRLAAMQVFQAVASRMQDGRMATADSDKWDCLCSVLDHVAQTCSAKEVLLAALEQLEATGSAEMFGVLCTQLRHVFIRLPTKRAPEHAFTEALQLMLNYVHSLPAAPHYDLDDDETALAEDCAEAQRLVACANSCVRFIQPFVSELLHHPATPPDQSRLLVNFVLCLFEHPISTLHWTFHKPHLHRGALELIRDAFELVGALCADCVWRLPATADTDSDTPDTLDVGTQSCLGTVALAAAYTDGCLHYTRYNAIVDVIADDRLQCCCAWSVSHQLDVYTACLTACCSSRLSHPSRALAVRRVIALLHSLLQRQPANSLGRQWLTANQTLVDGLISTLFAQHLPEATAHCTDALQQLLRALDGQAQLALLRYCLQCDEHAHDAHKLMLLRAWLVDWWKQQLCSPTTTAGLYSAADVRSLLGVLFRLDEAECSDVMAGYSLHAAALMLYARLNTLPEQNKAFWSDETADEIRVSYLEPLQRAIELTDAHIKLEISNARKAGKSGKDDNDDDSEMAEATLHHLQLCHTKLELLRAQLGQAVQLQRPS